MKDEHSFVHIGTFDEFDKDYEFRKADIKNL